jgi:uncharacterized membrane protein
MWKNLTIILLAFISFSLIDISLAQTNDLANDSNFQISFSRGKVLEILEEGTKDFFGTNLIYQSANIEILNGKETGKIIKIEPGDMDIASKKQKLKQNETIIISKKEFPEYSQYQVTDKYRFPQLIMIFSIFLLITILLGGKKGFFSIIGLAFSILVITQFIIPQIFSGKNPIIISIIGSFLIAFISIYLSHGISKRTSIALGSTILTLCLSFVFAYFFVYWANLFGLGTEESFYLQLNSADTIDLQGILLGGIIIGTIGVLDDVTTTQVATIDELKKANKKLTQHELFKKGMSVGKEHIASMINTLALAYTGASLPLFLLFHLNNDHPLWVILNSEFIADEIVRTISGSLALILAVPLSTYLAAYFFTKKVNKK